MAKDVPTSVRRFGVRYGRTTKHRYGKIEEQYRTRQVCPYCKKPQVKRISAGIWQCQKCNSKFTGKAYSL
jgi:large subunit ribosomal protein L37Ae